MHFEFAYFSFFSYSFGIETTIRFIHSRRNFLENHILFQTKMGKVNTRFQTKTAQKPLPCGAPHTYMAYARENPPPPETWSWSEWVKRAKTISACLL